MEDLPNLVITSIQNAICPADWASNNLQFNVQFFNMRFGAIAAVFQECTTNDYQNTSFLKSIAIPSPLTTMSSTLKPADLRSSVVWMTLSSEASGGSNVKA